LIDGSASAGFRFRHADESPYGRVADPTAADHHAKAFFALTTLGFKQGEARRALDAVLRSCGRSQDSISHVGAGAPELTLDSLFRMALQELLPKSMRVA
jgi:Holliday junction resolvasome RuvABC DNA-binding subunit